MNEVIRVISCLFDKKILHAQNSIKSQQVTFAQIFFIRTKSIKSKQATFIQMFFIPTKKHRMHKKHKKHKKQTIDFHSDVFIRTKSIKSIKSAKSTKTSNKQLSSS